MQFKQLRTEAWKSQDFNGVWTHGLAIPVRRSNQLSYEATDSVSGLIAQLVDSVSGLIAQLVDSVSGFIAQLVRVSHRYREAMGSNPVEVLTFSGFCTQLLKLHS